MSSPTSPRVPCKGCGKPIVWGIGPDNKPIPLDPTPPVYQVEHIDNLGPTIKTHVTRNTGAMVSHFATCPKAGQFSRNKPLPPAAGAAG